MAISEVALAHYRRQVARARRASDAVGKLWGRVDRTRIADSWAELLRPAVALVTVAQADAAADSDDYLEVTTGAATAAPIDPDAFAGVASDGRDLDSLLFLPAITALREIGKGTAVETAMTTGAVELDMIVRTQVADAGRVADGVALAARPDVDGWIRVLVLPSCSRCIILAGSTYRWNDGFLRHPRCDCRHEPVADVDPDDPAINPTATFEAMSEAEQDQVFTNAGAQAIRDGADMAKVVNARRGMQTATDGRLYTTEAAGKRPRLMPEQIYREAGDDRDEAIRLLRLHGYLVRRARKARPEQVRPEPAPQEPSYDERVAAAATGEDALSAAPIGLHRPDRPEAFTESMFDALLSYASSGFLAVNAHLRGLPIPKSTLARHLERDLRGLEQLMAVSQLTRDVVTYRGVIDCSPMFGERLSGDLTGMEWREDAYVSTSADQAQTKFFMGGARPGQTRLLMRILSPAGTPAVEVSDMGEEAEVLLHHGLRMRVVEDRGVDPAGVRHVDVEVLGV